MVALDAVSKTLLMGGTALALAFGGTTALGEPTLECMESGGVASCRSAAECEFECTSMGYPANNSRCDLSLRCCYCTWY